MAVISVEYKSNFNLQKRPNTSLLWVRYGIPLAMFVKHI